MAEDEDDDGPSERFGGAPKRAARKALFTKAQSTIRGVSLARLLKWVWPGAPAESMAKMFRWICAFELARLRQPTPPLIRQQDRRQLTELFRQIDTDGSGFCSAEEIAQGSTSGGGEDGGAGRITAGEVQGLVDVETVRAVCGTKELTVDEFLQYMCEDGVRVNEQSIQAFRDGRQLKRVHWRHVGFSGWIYAEPKDNEMRQRHWAKLLEQELRAWAAKAHQERRDTQRFGQTLLGKIRGKSTTAGRSIALQAGESTDGGSASGPLEGGTARAAGRKTAFRLLASMGRKTQSSLSRGRSTGTLTSVAGDSDDEEFDPKMEIPDWSQDSDAKEEQLAGRGPHSHAHKISPKLKVPPLLDGSST